MTFLESLGDIETAVRRAIKRVPKLGGAEGTDAYAAEIHAMIGGLVDMLKKRRFRGSKMHLHQKHHDLPRAPESSSAIHEYVERIQQVLASQDAIESGSPGIGMLDAAGLPPSRDIAGRYFDRPADVKVAHYQYTDLRKCRVKKRPPVRKTA